ncbi:MAG: SDR family NAD(P)-dependent oxidoreductase [Mycobacteriales bacterium]
MVTGAASGIGRATALLLAREGATVYALDVNRDGGEAVVAAAGGLVRFIHCDVSSRQDSETAVARVLQEQAHIDLLVNNAGVMSFTSVVETEEHVWDKVLATNLTAGYRLARLCLPHMRSGASIVNVSSVHAQRSTALVAPYAASKAALEAFTRVLSIEVAGAGIRVNAVAPGAIDTPLLWSNPNIASGVEKLDGPVGQPEDVAAAIAFLCSTDARFVTGTTLAVDFGRLAAL